MATIARSQMETARLEAARLEVLVASIGFLRV
jgi:hypothetical protein